jgi:hypothetical protein
MVATLAVVGCAHVNDPYKDSSAAIDTEMTTASAEGFRGKAEFPARHCRNPREETVLAENGAVSHWPLWFEDEGESSTNDFSIPPYMGLDNRFAVTWVDYAHILYGPARMSLNLAALPISMAVTPPGTLMESNGWKSKRLVGRVHDAKRSDSVTREPPDVNIINKRRYDSPEEDVEPTSDVEQ